MVVQELIAKLGFDVDQGGLNSVDNALGNFAKKLTLAAAGIYAVKKAVEAAVWAVSESINAAAQKEDVTTQFKVLLGDLEAAKYLYQEINQYAAVSPFETAGLADGVKGLMAAGMSAKAAFTDIKMMGDIALGNQERLNRLSYVYGQTQSAHKLKGDDLRQYTEQGFSPLEVMSRKTGKSIEYYRKEMEQGRFTADMVRESLVIATSEGGRFYNGALEGSKTWNGMLSTARDNLRMLGAELGERVLPFLKEVLTVFFELWDTVAGSYRALVDFFAVMFDGGPTAITIAAMLAASLSTVADILMTIGSAVQFVIFWFQALSTVWSTVIGFMIDRLLMFPKLFLSAIWAAARAILWLGKVAAAVLPKGTINVSEIGRMEAGADQFKSDYVGSFGEYTSRGFGNGMDDTMASWDKFRDLSGRIGTTAAGAGKMKLTSAIEAKLAGAAGKQPVTINNQTNNLTINADDPMKAMFEPQAARFFQSAFVQLRHATT